MDLEAYDNFSWLTTNSAVPHLNTALELFEKNINPLKTAKLLRKTLPPDRAALVMEQAQLRLRARKKFEQADRMFFTGRSLEQSTSEKVANYKAEKFADCESVADICCGIGGDLVALARRSSEAKTVGVDIDRVACCFAAANLATHGIENVRIDCQSFESFDLSRFSGLHIDPDRRTKGRTVKGKFFEPKLSEIYDRVGTNQLLGIKVAPATEIEILNRPTTREWIGTWRECKEQVLWSGRDIDSSQKIATVVMKGGKRFHFCPPNDAEQSHDAVVAQAIGSYIYEPHATVLAAKLDGALAHEHDLRILARGVHYFTSDQEISGLAPILKGYRIEKILPADVKQIHRELKDRNVGHLEIKKRGVDQVLAEKVARFNLSGNEKATIILTRHVKSRRAIIATRFD
jgi:SAM-dependent methyltransferase